MEEEEIWKPIPSLNGAYEASNLGRIRNAKTKRIKSQYQDRGGYMRVGIYKNKKDLSLRVHNLVIEAFKGSKPFDSAQVNHKDGVKSNNRIDNLEWSSPAENTHHALRKDLMPVGEKHYKAKYKEEDILRIYRLYKSGYLISEIAKMFNDKCNNIRRIVKRERWKKTYDKYYHQIPSITITVGSKKPVIIYNDNERLEFESAVEVAKFLNVKKSSVYWSIKNKRQIKGYYLIYKQQKEVIQDEP